jgi:hypothetical protein
MSDITLSTGSSLLRRYIRSLLSESSREPAVGVDPRISAKIGKLGSYPGLGIQIEYHDEGVIIQYAKVNPEGDITPLSRRRRRAPVWGHMIISNDQENGPCLSDTFGEPWVIVTVESEAGAGWGPLLYDIAIEYASINGGGLMSDRGTVSAAAISVWDKYDARGDVSPHQLDITHDLDLSNDFERSVVQITPLDPSDDCVQTRALEAGGSEGWMNSPLSRLYRKAGTPAMDALNAAGLLWDET